MHKLVPLIFPLLLRPTLPNPLNNQPVQTSHGHPSTIFPVKACLKDSASSLALAAGPNAPWARSRSDSLNKNREQRDMSSATVMSVCQVIARFVRYKGEHTDMYPMFWPHVTDEHYHSPCATYCPIICRRLVMCHFLPHHHFRRIQIRVK